MKIRRKLKLLKISNYEDGKIMIKVPKIDEELVNFLEGIHMDVGFPLDSFDYDYVFSEIANAYYTYKWKKYEIDVFIDEDYLIIVFRFPKKEKDRIMKIIKKYTFLPDEKTKDINLKIEVDDK
jgi:hypothetical protein